ncbi:ATP-binding protein [Polaromonas sp. P1(28)-8]|nr:ATP-binding protein [Polaromonas sp. P1(28)-8]
MIRAQGLNLYDADATARTYKHLFETARTALQAGYPVILDAAFLRRAERAQALALARSLSVPFAIIDCKAALPVLRAPAGPPGDPSEADTAVLERLRTAAEPLASDELAFVQAMPGDGVP